MKTRHQRLQDEQAGVAPSPPRALDDTSRPRRSRAPKASSASQSHDSQPSTAAQGTSATGAAPSQTESTAQASAPITRNKKSTSNRSSRRTRATSKQPEQEDASDTVKSSASTQPESSAQASGASLTQADASTTSAPQMETTATAEGNTTSDLDNNTNGSDGETQILSYPAHPVSAAVGSSHDSRHDTPVEHAHPVQELSSQGSSTMAAMNSAPTFVASGQAMPPQIFKVIKESPRPGREPRPSMGTPPNLMPLSFTAGLPPLSQVPVASTAIPGLFPYQDVSSPAATSPAAQGPSSSAETPTHQARPVHEKRLSSETSQLFAVIVSSPTTATNPAEVTQHTQDTQSMSGIQDTLDSQSAQSASSTQGTQSPPGMQETQDSQNASSPSAPPDTPDQGLAPANASSAGPEPGSCIRIPANAAPLPFVPPHQVYGLPVNPDRPWSVITVLTDAIPGTVPGLSTAPQTFAFAIPSARLAEHLMLAAHSGNPGIPDLLNNDAGAKRLFENYKLTNSQYIDIQYVDNPRFAKRKRVPPQNDIDGDEDDPQERQSTKRPRHGSERHPVVAHTTSKTRNTPASRLQSSKTPGSHPMRRAFMRQAAANKLAALEESNRARMNMTSNMRTYNTIMQVPNMYDENGALTLGKTKYVTVTVDETGSPVLPDRPLIINQPPVESALETSSVDESSDDEEKVQDVSGQPIEGPSVAKHDQAPETPRKWEWGLSSFLPSARTVSKLIPFSSRRVASGNAPSPGAPPSTPVQSAQQTRDVRTEPRAHAPNDDTRTEGTVLNATVGPGTRRQLSKKKQLLTKGQTEEREKLKKKKQEEREKFKKEKQELEYEKIRLEKEKSLIELERKDLEEERVRVEATQIGAKRKRAPSPDVIPLPPGGGFGLHPDYFYHSDADEDDDEDVSLSKAPAHKRQRVDLTVEEFGDPHMARPYTGTMFRLPAQTPRSENVFHESVSGEGLPLSSAPKPQPNSFVVPDDSDEESEQGSPAGKSTAASRATSQQSQSQDAGDTAPSPPEVDPPTNLFRKTTPTVFGPRYDENGKYIDAVERARRKALQHQPQKSSNLRPAGESSPTKFAPRMTSTQSLLKTQQTSSSTKDAGGDREAAESEYDPRRPALLPSVAATGLKSSQSISRTTTDATADASMPRLQPAQEQVVSTGQTHVQTTSNAQTPQVQSAATEQVQHGQQTSDGSSAHEQTVDQQAPIIQSNIDPNLGANYDAIDFVYKGYALTMSSRIQRHLESNWEDKDTLAAEAEVEMHFNEWKAKRDNVRIDDQSAQNEQDSNESMDSQGNYSRLFNAGESYIAGCSSSVQHELRDVSYAGEEDRALDDFFGDYQDSLLKTHSEPQVA